MENIINPVKQPFKNIQIKQRDATSLELKIRYLLKRELKNKNDYTINLFFFLPQSFNINSDTFEKTQFYSNLKLYIRFNTPSIGLKELLNKKSTVSPLARLESMLSHYEKKKEPLPKENFIYENKLLGCIYKSVLRDAFMRLKGDRQAEAGEKDSQEAFKKKAANLRRVAVRYHRFRKKADGVLENQKNLLRHFRLMDEHLSLLLERYLTSLSQYWQGRSKPEISGRILKIIQNEALYRKKMGLSTVLGQGSGKREQQEYIYREKVLKRYASEVLFFDIKRLNKRKGTEQVLYAFAAGLSMVFATAILFLSQPMMGNFTTPLFVMLVVSYMLKDRIKDYFKDLFNRLLGTHFVDRKMILYDPRHHEKLVDVEEKCFFLNRDRA
ncbi:MAG TPA: hypothetical protein VMX75_06840, partial [Spirochaetia bacterium]|nr:hypothetical protein [Spirochaetia bacterium]